MVTIVNDIGIKVHKLPVFVIGQMSKTALIGQFAQIAVEHYAQNGDNQGKHAKRGKGEFKDFFNKGFIVD